MLDLRDIQFVLAATSPRNFPRDGRPQVCFAGRSNVGKSSLINTLVGRRNLARCSKTPGRTREIHFYKIADRAYFVDLPGYGYARVSKQMRHSWGRLIETYLTDNEALRLVVVILDVRREPNEDDLDLIAWLEHRAIPYALVLTKSDKVSGNGFARQRKRILEALRDKLQPAEDGSADAFRVIRFSAKTGDGQREVAEAVLASLKRPSGKTELPAGGPSA